MKEAINILIVDNDMLLIESLVKVLDDFEEMNCIGFACSGQECLSRIKEVKPDIILMDIRMETPTAGIDTATKIILKNGNQAPKIIFFTAHPKEEKAVEKAMKGAACLDKNISIKDLVYFIKASHEEHLLMRGLSNSSKIEKQRKREFLIKRMSRPQFAIYYYLAKGYNIPFIAHQIGLLEETVRTYQRNIFARLSDFGVKDRKSLQDLENEFDLCSDFL